MEYDGTEEKITANVRWMTLMPFQGLATGSLFYVVFFEILEKERQKNVNGLLQVAVRISSESCLIMFRCFDDDHAMQVASMSAGYIFMVLLGLAEVRSERAEAVQVALL